jgi:hypothetical protein
MLKLEDFLEKERLSDLLSVATYGNGWPAIQVESYSKEGDDRCIEDVWADELLAGKNLSLYDMYDDNETGYSINLNSIKRGLAIMRDNYPVDWDNLINENEDLETGDVFLQCTVFGEVIYG